ncbi:MAG: nucleotidyl transferase AbiEii/AbiGii toxin family protein [Proteobacteria bacterium]|nr:nucleotidyl transferase AbiEii/AbiGii toxin family protein [Pseudomonadota bacterium]
MRKDVLTANQLELLPLIREFSREYYLAGGTAIALYLGHRKSIDFDLFTSDRIKRQAIKRTLDRFTYPVSDILFEDSEQLHIIINAVKVTFFSYPYPVLAKTEFEQVIRMPELLTLSAMKAYALGGRAKWKDYVDLFFLLSNHFSLQQIAEQAKGIFGAYFNEKLFREQLCYFQDIDDSEKVDFVAPAVYDGEIKRFLTEVATTPFHAKR